MSKKVTIKSITLEDGIGDVEITEVWIGDKKIGEGTYGGEPEDNCRYRDYLWVEDLLMKLATELGAEVEVQKIEQGEEP